MATTVALYNTQGQASGTVELPAAVFAVPLKEAVVYQVYQAQQANRREPWAHTKDRGDVRGGGKKPWKQKGTGRARHGSIRSPIWRGGGVTFGPLKERRYTQAINKKMNREAVRMCLSDKVSHGQFIVVESLMSDGKTKTIQALRSSLPGMGAQTMMLLANANPQAQRAMRNIPRMTVRPATDVNVLDLVDHQYVITTKDAIVLLEKRLAPRK